MPSLIIIITIIIIFNIIIFNIIIFNIIVIIIIIIITWSGDHWPACELHLCDGRGSGGHGIPKTGENFVKNAEENCRSCFAALSAILKIQNNSIAKYSPMPVTLRTRDRRVSVPPSSYPPSQSSWQPPPSSYPPSQSSWQPPPSL